MVSRVNVIPWGTTALDPLGQLPADFLPDKYPGNAPSIDSGAPPLGPNIPHVPYHPEPIWLFPTKLYDIR